MSGQPKSEPRDDPRPTGFHDYQEPAMLDAIHSTPTLPETAAATARFGAPAHGAAWMREMLPELRAQCARELAPLVSAAIDEAEKQLIRLADKATLQQQNVYFDSAAALGRGRAAAAPRFLDSLAQALDRFASCPQVPATFAAATAAGAMLSLDDGVDVDQASVLADMALKVELRVREPLYALGLRLGALAGNSRVPVESMPLGPRSVAQAIADAAGQFELPLEHRLVLLRCSERVVMSRLDAFYVALNAVLAERGVLRDLHTLASVCASARSERTALDTVHPGPAAGAGESPARATEDFDTLRKLLQKCRRAETCEADAGMLQNALAELQRRLPAWEEGDRPLPIRTDLQLQSDVLLMLRESVASGGTFALRDEDRDTIDLLAMLFDFLARQTHAGGVARHVLARLQIPLLRVALRDKRVLGGRRHAAWQLLESLLETARLCVDEAAPGNDTRVVDALRRATAQVAQASDITVFAAVHTEFALFMEQFARRAAALEQRQVDAAMAREKLARARQQAQDDVARRLGASMPAEFLRGVLERAWTDALAAVLLSEGAHGPGYARRLRVMDKLLAASRDAPAPLGPEEMAEFRAGLAQAGVPADDAEAMVQRLFADASDADAPSQTELAIKLKANARFGTRYAAQGCDAVAPTQNAATAAARIAFARLCTLPTGSWLAFRDEGAATTVRCKLAWYSTHNGNCLLVDRCGTPADGFTLHELAQALSADRVRLVEADEATLLDRAWKDLYTMLRGFAAPRPAATVGALPSAAHPAGAQPDDGAPTLLLVDDEVNILRALTRALHYEGYRVLSTTSAAEALRLLGETTVHVIVSDQRMPEMNGTDFLAAAERACPHTVRILLSGFSGGVEAMDAINRGVVHKYLTKPWTDADFRAQVREAFELAGVSTADLAA